jgi:hypothetical protein
MPDSFHFSLFSISEITNYRWCRTVCRLITHSPPVFGESTTFVTVAETAGIMRPQAAIRLRSQKRGALGHLSSCCKVMIPDSARRAFSLLLRQDGSGRQRGLFLIEG